MNVRDSNTVDKCREIFAGGAIGLLIGLLVGLAVSPVVAGLISALTAVLATFFGFKTQSEPEGTQVQSAPQQWRTWRAIAFGFVCSAAVLGGLYIRTHNILGQSPRELVDAWTAGGYPPEIARQLVVHQLFGSPQELKDAGQKAVAAEANRQLVAALFAGPPNSECQELTADRYPDPNKRANAFRRAGDAWQTFADAVQGLRSEQQEALLEAAWKLACESRK